MNFKSITIAGGVVAASMLAPSAFAQGQLPAWCASGKLVKFAGVTWESAQFYTEVARQIVENGFGCKTEVVPGSTSVTETALVTNDLQVWMEQWGGRTEVIKKGHESGKVELVGSLLKGGTVEGWYVPEYVVKGDPKRNIAPMAPGLKSVADLPKYKDLFKDDEDPSKGRFLNCPTGWDCEKNNNQKLKAYKLTDSYVDFRPGTGGALDATIASAIERGKPILFYYWSPAGLMGKYKFIKLDEPAYNEACWKTLYNSTTDNVCGSATPSTNLSVGVSTPFESGAPEIVAFLSALQMPAEMLNRIIAEMTEKKTPAADVAHRFLVQNKALWKTWVPANVAQTVEAKLK